MDDHDVDVLLRGTGETFRATHTRTAPVAVRRSRPLLLPLVSAAVTALIIVGVTLVLPDSKTETPVVPARPVTVATNMSDVLDVAFDEDWLAVSGGELGQNTRGRIELRRRDDPGRVTATITTSYPYGSLGCLALDGDELLWMDNESVVTDYAPGPPTRWSLWQRDLVTGAQTQLAHGLPADSMTSDVSCAVASGGKAAWQLNGKIIIRDLVAGTELSLVETATPIALGPAGLVLATFSHDTQVALRTGPAYADRRALVSIPRGTDVAAGPDRLITFAVDPASGTADGGIVSTCELPACPALTELRRDPSSGQAVVGDGFAAWSDLEDAPAVARFDGRKPPPLAPGYSAFQTLAAYGDTLAYGTRPLDESGYAQSGPTTIHLLQITGGPH